MNHLLLLVHRIPFPPNKGDKVRSFNLLKYLAQHYHVHLGTFVDAQEDWQYVDKVKEYCHDSYFAGLNPTSARLKSLRGLFTGDALTLSYYFDAGLQQWVGDKLASEKITHAVVFSSPMAQYLPDKTSLTRVADLVDVDSDKWGQYAKSKSWPLSWIYRREANRLLDYERRIARQYDATVLVNENEAALLQSLTPESAARITYANNGVDTDYFAPSKNFNNPYQKDEPVLAFTGAMDYWPNVDAVEWFAHEVFKRLYANNPRLRFFIVGSRPAPRVKRLAELPGVFVTGPVPDIRPYLAHAAIVVAPLRIARGTQNKVLEAMSMAKLVIASSEAAQGVSARANLEIVIAKNATEFLDEISARLNSQERELIGCRARARVIQDYSWNANLSRIGLALDPSLADQTRAASDSASNDPRILRFPIRKPA